MKFQTHSDLVFLPTVVQKKTARSSITSSPNSPSSKTSASGNR